MSTSVFGWTNETENTIASISSSGVSTIGGGVPNAIVRFDDVTGKTIKSSMASINDIGTLSTVALSTDVVNERTANAGVTIDGVLIKDNTITANGVVFNSETITSLPANISTTVRYTFINLSSVLTNLFGTNLTTEIYEGGNTRHPILPIAPNGTLKTIKLDEGYPFPITIETSTSVGGSPFTRYFTVSPSNRTLHLRYNGSEGAWELDESSNVSWLFNTNDTTPVNVFSGTYYPQTNYDGSRLVYLEFDGANPTNLVYRSYTSLDYTTAQTLSVTPFFATTANTSNVSLTNWSLAISANGLVVAVGNKGNGTTDWGEIAIFRFNSGTGLYVHDITFSITSATGFGFGWCIQLSADGTRLVSRNTTEVFIYGLSLLSATLQARFTVAGSFDSNNTITISGDGLWVGAGDSTTRNLFVWQFSGSWAQVYTTPAVAYGAIDFDYYGTTLMVGDSEFYSSLKGVVRIYSRRPKALGSSFVLLQAISIPESFATNPTQGITNSCKLSADGLTMVRSDRYRWGIDTRASLQAPFTEFATQGQGFGNYGTAWISPDASTITLCRLVEPSRYRIQIRERPASDMNRNLIDVDEASNLAMIKADGYVGGSLQVASNTDSTSAQNGSIVCIGGAGIAGRINTDSYIRSINADTSTSVNTSSFRRGNGAVASGWVALEVGSNSSSASSPGNKILMGNNSGACTIIASTNTHSGAQPLTIGENVLGSILTLRGIDIPLTTTNGVSCSSTVDSTSSTTGSMRLAGGLGVVRNITSAGIIRSTNTTASVSTTTGSIVTAGGLGVALKAYIGDTAPSTSTTTGALIVAGGIASGQSIFCNQNVIAGTAPTLGTHLCNKTYVDNIVSTNLTVTTAFTPAISIISGVTSIGTVVLPIFVRCGSVVHGSFSLPSVNFASGGSVLQFNLPVSPSGLWNLASGAHLGTGHINGNVAFVELSSLNTARVQWNGTATTATLRISFMYIG